MSGALPVYTPKTTTISGPLTTANTDIDASAISSAITLTLPTFSTSSDYYWIIQKVDSSAFPVVIVPTGSATINGNSSKSLLRQFAWTLIVPNDGAGANEWYAKGISDGLEPFAARLVNSTTVGTAVSLTDTSISVDAGTAGGAVTLRLPAIGTATGFYCYFQRIDSTTNAVSIAVHAGDSALINGVNQYPLFPVANTWTLLIPNASLTAWEAKGISDLYARNPVNVLDYIPQADWANIAANTSGTPLTTFLNTAHAAAAGSSLSGGFVYYPAGTYNTASVVYYAGQTIQGAGRDATTINQIGTTSIFMSYQYANNMVEQPLPAGPVIRDINFNAASTASAQGFAIIDYGDGSRIENLNVNNFPILLTALTISSDPPMNMDEGSRNHRFTDIYFTGTARGYGGLQCDSNVTDTMVSLCSFNGCGNATTGAIDASTLAGWHINNNKIYSSINYMIRSSSGSKNCLITSNNLDMNAIGPANKIFTGILLTEHGTSMGLCIVGNVFRVEPMAIASGSSYTLLLVDPGTSTGSITHTGNHYSFTGTGTYTLAGFDLLTTGTITGISSGNFYDNFLQAGATEQGTGEYLLQQVPYASIMQSNTLSPAPVPPATGYAIFCDTDDQLKVIAASGTISTIALELAPALYVSILECTATTRPPARTSGFSIFCDTDDKLKVIGAAGTQTFVLM